MIVDSGNAKGQNWEKGDVEFHVLLMEAFCGGSVLMRRLNFY